MERERLFALISCGLLVSSLMLSGGSTLAQAGQPLQQVPPPPMEVQPQPAPPAPPTLQQAPQVAPLVQPAPSLEKKPAQPAGAVEKKPAQPAETMGKKPAETMGKKLAPRLNCGPGWRPVGEMSCEAVKPIVQSQCPPGTNYFEGKFLVGCR